MRLIYFWAVEEHHPERVFCQFGMKQLPSGFVDTSKNLHKISLQGGYDKDWAVKHAPYIQQWSSRGQCVCDAPIVDGDMMFLDAYMKWYIDMTR